MGKTNASWHAANRMPPRPTLAQRVDWHIAHAAHCACRTMPETIKAEISRRAGQETAKSKSNR